MLDPNFIRENKAAVHASLTARHMEANLLDRFLESDEVWRKITRELEERRARKKQESASFEGGEKDEKTQGALREEKKKLQELEAALEEVAKERESFLLALPNIIDSDVPVGKDESENKVLRAVGKPTEFSFKPKDHVELGTALGLIDTERASGVSGARFAYMKNELVLLEFAIIRYALDLLTSQERLEKIAKGIRSDFSAKPFVPVLPPMMMKADVMRKMARLSDADKDERYHLPQDDLYLVGSAEHTLGPLHMSETLHERDLPIRYIGFSTSFRREAGSYGKDTKGILRLHQFDKLEMESFTTPQDSKAEQDFIVAIQEELLRGLGLPYQVIAICTGDMGKPDARQIDIETWMPGQERYRETHTSDLMTDYQARRLKTRVKLSDGTTLFAHMNDATAFAIGRILIAIMENYQTKEGGIAIPQTLISYVGKSEIRR
jgi:seryl-tRNA synthetase